MVNISVKYGGKRIPRHSLTINTQIDHYLILNHDEPIFLSFDPVKRLLDIFVLITELQ